MVVPLGNRSVTGIVVDPAGSLETGQTPPDKIKSILEILDDEAFLPGDVVDLALWVAEYYACGAGDALAAAVPSTRAHKTIRIAVLTAQGHDQNCQPGESELHLFPLFAVRRPVLRVLVTTAETGPV